MPGSYLIFVTQNHPDLPFLSRDRARKHPTHQKRLTLEGGLLKSPLSYILRNLAPRVTAQDSLELELPRAF